MTLPKTVTIGGQRVRIKIAPMEDTWGTYEHDAREITIATGTLRKRSLLRETLRHEMLHAALAISGVSYLESYEEEVVVRAIEQTFWPAWERVRAKLTP